MKNKEIYISFVSLFFLFSCNENYKSHENKIVYFPKLIPEIAIMEADSIEIKESLQASISYIDSLVENHKIESRFKLPNSLPNTKKALLNLRSGHEDTLKYYLTLLLIKNYRFHIECCRQGYEIRSDKSNFKYGIDTLSNPVLYEFLRFSKSFDKVGYPIETLVKKRFEFMNSGLIMDWLKKEPKYLKYSKVKEHYDFIKTVERNNDYW